MLEVNFMNPVSVSSAFRAAQSQNDGAAVLVMKKALDVFKQDGNNTVNLLASIPKNAEPNLGSKIDIRV